MQKIKVICGYLKKICVVKNTSFSLIESAVVLAVAGSVIGGGLTAYKSTNPKVKSDLKKMQAIENALQQYFTTNGRLPFPARASDVKGTANYLLEYKTGAPSKYSSYKKKCTSDGGYTSSSTPLFCSDNSCTDISNPGECSGGNLAWGVIPTRTLGLPDDYAYDSKGHNFEYILDNQMAFPVGFQYYNPHKKANYTTSKNGKYQVFYEVLDGSTEKPFALDLFNLSIINNSTNKPVNNTQKNTAYVLLSKGQTDTCFWDNKGTSLVANTTIPTDNTKYNCQANYVNGQFDSLQIYQGYSKSFDNLVRYKTISEMMQMVTNVKEDARTLGQSTTQYQLKIDQNLITNSKEVVGAINEVEEKVKFVSTFNGVQGIRAQLYYLYTEEDNITVNGQPKHYKRGLYIYNENATDPSLSDFKLVSGSGGGVPVGSIVAYSGTDENPQSGFLWCDGAKYNKLIYPELYQAIGETYTPAAEKGGTTFRVPDLTDKIPWQSGSLSGAKAVGDEIPAGVPNITGTYQGSSWETQYIGSGAGSYAANSALYYTAGKGSRPTHGSSDRPGGISFDASRSNPIYGSSTIVQPPAISMRFMIRYTTDEETAKEVFDFSEEVRRQLAKSIMAEEIQKAICEKSYPVGSVYQNYNDDRDPNAILGCGEWANLGDWKTFAFHLGVRHDDLNTVIGINTTDSAGGPEVVMPFSSSCLPNIKGSMDSAFQGYPKWYGYSGAIQGKDWRGDNSWEDNTGGYSGFSFDASRYNPNIYKDACKRVMPDTLWVYTWVRKS